MLVVILLYISIARSGALNLQCTAATVCASSNYKLKHLKQTGNHVTLSLVLVKLPQVLLHMYEGCTSVDTHNGLKSTAL